MGTRLTLVLVGYFLTLPKVLQEVIFEELMLLLPLGMKFAALVIPLPPWLDSTKTRRGNVEELILVLGVFVLLSLIGIAYFVISQTLNQSQRLTRALVHR